jgi:hypothetical protein
MDLLFRNWLKTKYRIHTVCAVQAYTDSTLTRHVCVPMKHALYFRLAQNPYCRKVVYVKLGEGAAATMSTDDSAHLQIHYRHRCIELLQAVQRWPWYR